MAGKKVDKAAAEPTKDEPQAESIPGASISIGEILKKMEEYAEQNLALKNEIEALRKTAGVMPKEEGGSRIVSGKAPDIEIPRPLPRAEGGNEAVFRSPYPGFKQVIKKSQKHIHPNGEYTIEPPIFAEFLRGVCVLHDPELIDLMRAKMKEKLDKGEADFIEVTDPDIKEDARHGIDSIKSEEVTTDTPANVLI